MATDTSTIALGAIAWQSFVSGPTGAASVKAAGSFPQV